MLRALLKRKYCFNLCLQLILIKKKHLFTLLFGYKRIPNMIVFQMDYKDSRFNRLYTDPAFNIDPSLPNFKKTAIMEGLIEEKLKRRKNQQLHTAKKGKNIHVVTTKASDDQDLSSLVSSVKAKAEKMKTKKKKNSMKRILESAAVQ